MNKGDLITSVAMLSGLTKRAAEKENIKAEKNPPKVVAKDDKASPAKAKKPKKS
jgi:hypothetical protein